MTAAASSFFVVTLVVAGLDWFAVWRRIRPLELVAKPLTMVALIAAVVTLEPTSSSARVAFVVALVFSLVGDVFLMTKRSHLFVFGLASFLAGHVAYVVGLWWLGVSVGWFIVGLALVAVGLATVGRRVFLGVRAGDQSGLAGPVLGYMIVISAMVASAVGTHRSTAIVGAALFYASDALIAWTRFIAPKPWGDLAVIITYHLGQIGLALALVG